MPVEQSGAEASPNPAKSAGPGVKSGGPGAKSGGPGTKSDGPAAQSGDAPPAADLQDTAKADLEELKRKFREALERKRGTHASANAEGAQDTGKVHGSHGPAASRRSFRRKAGG